MLSLLIVCSAGACAVVSGVFGMGGGMILMGILAAALPVASAMILHGVVQLAANGSRAMMLSRSIEWKIIRRFLFGATLALGLFAWLRITVSKQTLFLFLGGIPLAFTLLPRLPALDVSKRSTAAVAGVLVTSMQLVAGVSGPVLDVFFLRAKLNRYQVVATKASIAVLGHVFKLVYYGLLLSSDTSAISAWMVPAVVAAAVVGTRVGKFLLTKLSEQGFRRYCRWLVGAIAVVYCTRGLSSFI